MLEQEKHKNLQDKGLLRDQGKHEEARARKNSAHLRARHSQT